MSSRRARFLAGALTAAFVAALPTAEAHQTAYSPDGKIRFVYGNQNEPVYTFQKTGLDLGFFDNVTGSPIPGLAASEGQTPGAVGYRIWLVYAGLELELTSGLREQFGRPGWVTYPYMLTRPGAYSVRIQGAINGTAVNQTIAPRHDILAMGEIMWPAKFPTPDNETQQLEALKMQVNGLATEVAALKAEKTDGGKSPGPGVALVVLAGLGAAALSRRRRT